MEEIGALSPSAFAAQYDPMEHSDPESKHEDSATEHPEESEQSSRAPTSPRSIPLLFEIVQRGNSGNELSRRLHIRHDKKGTVKQWIADHLAERNRNNTYAQKETLFFEFLAANSIERATAERFWGDYHFLGVPVAYFLRIDASNSPADSVFVVFYA